MTRFFLKGLGSFEQDVQVTEVKKVEVPIAAGDEVIVQMRATVRHVLKGEHGVEVDLQGITPQKIVSVIRQKGKT